MRTSGYTQRDLVAGLICLAVVAMTVAAVGQSAREAEFRTVCENHLRILSKATMLYANDYQDALPKAGVGKQNTWVPTLPDWRSPSRQKAYDVTPEGGKATVTSCLYLLVKHAEVEPGIFVCPSENQTRAFTLNDVPETLPEGFTLQKAWDFGGRYDLRNNPAIHCSYSYHAPFGPFALTTNSEAGMAILADRNPWMDPNRVRDPNTGWQRFEQAGSVAAGFIGNSDTHQCEGQNVLFMDGHVVFKRSAACGVDKDNIYTIASGDRGKGLVPRVYSLLRPADERDSVLVQDVAFDVPKPASVPGK